MMSRPWSAWMTRVLVVVSARMLPVVNTAMSNAKSCRRLNISGMAVLFLFFILFQLLLWPASADFNEALRRPNRRASLATNCHFNDQHAIQVRPAFQINPLGRQRNFHPPVLDWRARWRCPEKSTGHLPG